MNLRELVGVLGHELRTPLAAILGYQELLADGIYGKLDARQEEPIERIQFSAHQLLHLIDGLQELVDSGTGQDPDLIRESYTRPDEIETTSGSALIDLIQRTAKPYAAGRSVTLDCAHHDQHAITGVPVQRFLRAADLGLIAAIKSSAGRTLNLRITETEDAISLIVGGTSLDPGQDDPNLVRLDDRAAPLSAARLRLAMASSTARAAGGSLRLEPADNAVSMTLRLPRTAT